MNGYITKEQEKLFVLLEKHTEKIETPLDVLQSVRGTDPFKTLIQTILTAQTKDQVTTPVSRHLFEEIGETAKDFAHITVEELESFIGPVSYYKTKARHIVKTIEILLTKYNGAVPKTFDELVALPGVGPKTANLVLNEAFGIPAIIVDIHVHRISNRLGFIQTNTREKSLKELEKVLPKRLWVNYNKTLVKHGQSLCTPTSPKCSECPVSHLCPKVGVEKQR